MLEAFLRFAIRTDICALSLVNSNGPVRYILAACILVLGVYAYLGHTCYNCYTSPGDRTS